MALLDKEQGLTLETNMSLGENGPDSVVALQEGKSKSSVEKENEEYSSLVAYVEKAFYDAKTYRLPYESIWLENFRNFRGLYSQEVQWREEEKSRAFIKITKTKVLASYAQVTDILFSGQKFPIGVEPQKEPVGDVADAVYFDPKEDELEQKVGKKQGTIARQSIFDSVGPYKGMLERIKDKVREGFGKTPTSQTFEPNKEAAKNMEKKIHTQLEEANASKSLRNFTFEMCLFGTGIYKGPYLQNTEYPKWEQDGTYNPVFKPTAGLEHVSIWDAYPDPDANNMTNCEFFIQRHKMSKSQLRQLKNRPFFREQSIDMAIEKGPNYTPEYWETTLQAESGSYVNPTINRYEVLEYWGIADKQLVEQTGIEMPKEYDDMDQVQVNIYICNSELLRVVFNPFKPARIPYYSCPYEVNPYAFWGIGVAENMADTQLLMNGFLRLAVDNAVLSSNVMLDIDEDLLVPGQNMKLFPGKVWRRAGGQPGQSIHPIQIPNKSQECLQLFDKARQLADEATGMPSYAHGQSGVTGVGRTASGMQMLMGAAAQNIKAVVRNIDDYLLVPLGKALFAFNMQFDFDEKYIGDLSIVARGTESLMRNEIRSQKLMQLLQISGNPMDAPFIKRDYIWRELVADLDIDADKAVNDPREAAIQAQMLKDYMQSMGIDPNKQKQGGGNPAQQPNVDNPNTSGGVPIPGEKGFDTGGGSNIGQTQNAGGNSQNSSPMGQ